MRLLRSDLQDTFSFVTSFYDSAVPPYAILSHTWSAGNEVLYSDIQDGRWKHKRGYVKLNFCAEQAKRDGLEYFWIDTCCIDKTSSVELTEAINSMFNWYRNAAKCYVYLSDISSPFRPSQGATERLWKQSLKASNWFTRGWTLPELLAPKTVEFFSREGDILGSNVTLVREIHERTGIPVAALRGQPLSQFPVPERMRWAEGRRTTRSEDQAYCLMGLFDVYMPLLYGEGPHAFERLQREIAQKAPESISFQNEEDGSVNITPNDTFPQRCYGPLKTSGFRLLTIHPGRMGQNVNGYLREHNLANPPSYYALSYVWGQEPPIHSAIINGEEQLIQPNLFHALQRVRIPNGEYSVWVDALCINQEDNSERKQQVRMMSTIYSSASGVLIWLGEEDSTSKLALEFVSEVTSDKFRWGNAWWEQYGFAALSQVLERAWFRRGWVLQEAAFSKNSTIRCGDQEVHMDYFTTAIRIIRDRLSTVSLSFNQMLANFHDSPAIRLIDTVTAAIRPSAKTEVSRRRMSLEKLVYSSVYSETSDQRDTIYALLNLANDVISNPMHGHLDSIDPDYTKPVLDVFVDFVLHCCIKSGYLDVICHPWAPIPSLSTGVMTRSNQAVKNLQVYPSWIVTKDKLPFGNPAWQSRYRLHGVPLVRRASVRCYFAHYGKKPHIFIGKSEHGTYDGSLHATGIVLGEIVERSARMADAIITKECVDILKIKPNETHENIAELEDIIWRTLCADRDGNGERAPHLYGQAMIYLLATSSRDSKPRSLLDMLDDMVSIDPEELLELELPEHVEEFLKVIRDVTWNRRTFSMKDAKDENKSLVGLVPRHARIGDHVCILYGCSVPVVLRKLRNVVGKPSWQLVGDAYVHGVMNGEAISRLSPWELHSSEVLFKLV